MAKSVIVSGEALLRTGTGATSALEDLGVAVDGVEIELRDFTEPVFTDTFGPDVPFDEQQFLEDALIRAQLVFYDDAVLGRVRSRASGTDGTIGNAGTLWGASSKYFRLLILSPTAALPWNFLSARLRNSASQKIGTRRTLWQVEFYAVPYSGVAGATSGGVLYNRSTS